MTAREVDRSTWAEFNAAVDQLRLRIMASGVSGRDAIDEALAAELNGKTLVEVLQAGDRAELEALAQQSAGLKAVIDGNALLAAAPRETELAAILDEKRSAQRARLQALNRQVAALKERAARHGTALPPLPETDPAPRALSRDEAQHELASLLQRRQSFFEEKYGDWPARIGFDGMDVEEDVVESVAVRREAAATTGNVVIPVYVRARWRIFDAPVRVPVFTEAVMGNLTEEDRAAFARQWAENLAEAWARRDAAAESVEEIEGVVKENIRKNLPK